MGISAFDSGLAQAEASDLASLNRPLTDRERERKGRSGGGDRRSGWLYRPAGASGALPIVVLAHGLGATHTLHYWRAAETFARAGYAVLDFDPRHIGESGGEPRQALSLKGAIADLRAAVVYARSRTDVADPGRVILYGSSIGGGMVIEVAAGDAGLAALVLVVPMVDGLTNLPDVPVRGRARLLRAALDDRMRALRRRERRLLRLFGEPDDEQAVISSDGAGPLLREEIHPEGSWAGDVHTGLAGSFRNELTAWDILTLATFRPGRRLKNVSCPVLVVVGTKDRVTPPKPQLKTARAAGAEVVELPYEHFGVFRGDGFTEAVEHEIAFLRRHVPVADG